VDISCQQKIQEDSVLRLLSSDDGEGSVIRLSSSDGGEGSVLRLLSRMIERVQFCGCSFQKMERVQFRC
jgi:hypothetical protein